MPTEAIIVVDTSGFEDIDNQAANSINGQINRAENNGIPLFYVLPEGEELHEDVEEATVASILRYSDEEDFYRDARIDEQLTNRDIEEVKVIGASNKSEKIKEKEQNHGRSISKSNGSGNGKSKGNGKSNGA